MVSIYGSLLIPTHPFFDISFVIIIGSVMYLCNQRVSIAVGAFFIVLQACLNITVITVYNNTGMVFHFSQIALKDEVGGAINHGMFPWWTIGFMVLCLALYITAACLIDFFIKNKLKDTNYNKISSFVRRLGIIIPVFLICLFGMLFGFYGRFLKDSTVGTKFQILGDREAYLKFSSPKSDLQKFGVIGYYVTDVVRWSFKIKYVSQIPINPPVEDEFNAKDFFGIAKDNNLLYIIAESFDSYLISEELTPVLYGLKHGYNFTKDNFYKIYDFSDASGTDTLVRKDYNLTKETNDYVYTKKQDAEPVLDKDNFDKYGISLPNFYNAQPTNISEFEFFMSPLPSSVIETGVISESDAVHPEVSLRYILQNSGRIKESLYTHANPNWFYGKEFYISELGYDEYIFNANLQSLTNNGTNVNLDSEFVKDNLDKIIHSDFKSGNWYSQHLTITTHGGYSGDLVNGLDANHSEEFANYYAFVDAWRNNMEITEEENNIYQTLQDNAFPGFALLPNFYAKALDTEHMMARIMDGLIKTGQLDKTVIIFAADHQSYMQSLDTQYKKVFYDNFSENSSNRWNVEAFMWGKCLNFGTADEPKNLYVTKFTTRTDFMPTILTMFGINYDSSYFVGHILIDEVATACVYSAVGIFNDKYFTLDSHTILSIDNILCNPPIEGILSSDDGVSTFVESILSYIDKRRYIDVKLSEINAGARIWWDEKTPRADN
jgi:hypothetical protein